MGFYGFGRRGSDPRTPLPIFKPSLSLLSRLLISAQVYEKEKPRSRFYLNIKINKNIFLNNKCAQRTLCYFIPQSQFCEFTKKDLKKRFKIGDIDIITLLNSWI